MGYKQHSTFMAALLLQLAFMTVVDANGLFSRSSGSVLSNINNGIHEQSNVHAAVLPRGEYYEEDDDQEDAFPSEQTTDGQNVISKRDTTPQTVLGFSSANINSPFGYNSDYVYGHSDTTYGSCVYLDTDSICGSAFSGYPIPYDSSVNVVSSHGFDNYIESYVLNNDYVSKNLQEVYGCSKANKNTAKDLMRYQASMWCARSVQRGFKNGCGIQSSMRDTATCDSINTGKLPGITENYAYDLNSNAAPLLLNYTSCTTAVQTVKSIFQDSSLCTATDYQSYNNRNATVSAANNYCTEVNSAISNSGYFSGTRTESLFCGWRDADAAVKACKDVIKNINKPINSLNTKSQPYMTSLSYDDIEATRGCCVALKNNPNYSKKFRALSTGAIIGIVIGCVAFVVIVAAIIYACWKRRKDAQSNNTAGIYTPPKKTSKFKLFFVSTIPAFFAGIFAKKSWTTKKNAGLATTPTGKKVTIAGRYDSNDNIDWSKEKFSTSTNYYYVNEKGEQVPFSGAAAAAGAAAAGAAVAGSKNYPASTTTTTTRTSFSTTSTGNTSMTGSESASMPTITPKAFAVLHGYNPTMEDEIALEAGQAITLLCKFDDGWGIGCVCSCERPGCPGSIADLANCNYTGVGIKPLPGCKARVRGVFPLICGTEFDVSESDFVEAASFEFDNEQRKSIINKKLEAIYQQSDNKANNLSADHRRSSLYLRSNFADLVR